jgi:3-oxoacyl-[acyl-carrier-protein] synthase II
MSARASEEAIVITGTGIQLPGVNDPLELLTAVPNAEANFDPKSILGRKGLFGKDRATLLALCAAKHAFQEAKWPETGIDPARVGVVVSSNFGNLDTVERVLATLARGGPPEVSMMDAPNASSNVIASTLAIRFNCKGPNYMICSGATASGDALRVARLTLRADRADAVIVVGVEPRNPVVRQFVEPNLAHEIACEAVCETLVDGAAALLLERESKAKERGVRALFRVGDSCRSSSSLVVEIEQRLGRCHGVLAIVQAVLACAVARARDDRASAAVLDAGTCYEREWTTTVLEPMLES